MSYPFVARNPYVLIAVGLVAAGYGIHLIIRGIQGDTLLPGTIFTYVPRWLFVATGIVLQAPLIGAVWFLSNLGYLPFR